MNAEIEPFEETPGQVAFEAYGATTGGKTFDGRPIPEWSELPATVRLAWCSAAAAVLRAAARGRL